MPVEMLTYADLASRLKVSPEAARALAKRLKLARFRRTIDGKTLVSVDPTGATVAATRPMRHAPPTATSETPGETGAAIEAQIAGLREVVELLRRQLDDVREDRDRWRSQAERLTQTTDAQIAALRDTAELLRAQPADALSGEALKRLVIGGTSGHRVPRKWA